MNPALTIIMPVRNGARHLEEALASLENQSMRNFVLYVWDDRSDDDTAEILKRWLPTRLPGKMVGNQRVGIGVALARLVDSSSTDLIARMDADDLCHPERLNQQYHFMQQHQEVTVLGTQMLRIDEHGQVLGTTDHPTTDADIRWQMRLNNPINHPTVMMRRSAVLAGGNYHDLRPGQDDDLWLRLSQRYRFANLTNALLTYREHANSITGKQNNATQRLRQRRMADCQCVFPGLAKTDAQRLTHLLTHPDELGVTHRDVQLLEEAAQQFASRSEQRIDDITKTQAYREQHLNLRTRRWKSGPVCGRIWPVLKAGLSITSRSMKQSRPRHNSARQRSA